MLELRARHRGVELNENFACNDVLSIMEVDGAYDASLKWLDELGSSTGNDLAECGSDDVYGTDRCPHRETEECDDRCRNCTPHRRGRYLDDLECRRQELRFVVGAANP